MPLHVRVLDGVAILTLDDPERRNALSSEMVDQIVATMHDFETNTSGSAPVRAVVVTGAGAAFCSGADVGNLVALTEDEGGDAREVRRIYDGFLAVRNSPLPTIAAVNGPAVGAGFNLALSCDLRIASSAARFDTRFATIGLHPGGGHVWMLERLGGPQTAAAMVAFGERINGTRAAELGLVWQCVEEEVLLESAVELAKRAASVPRDLMAKIKATLREAAWEPDFDTALLTELDRQAWSFAQGYLNERVRRP